MVLVGCTLLLPWLRSSQHRLPQSTPAAGQPRSSPPSPRFSGGHARRAAAVCLPLAKTKPTLCSLHTVPLTSVWLGSPCPWA